MPTCRSCDARIIWIETTKGKKHPIDEVPEKRWVFDGEDWTLVDTYISHFSTCPDSKKWSGHGSSEASE